MTITKLEANWVSWQTGGLARDVLTKNIHQSVYNYCTDAIAMVCITFATSCKFAIINYGSRYVGSEEGGGWKVEPIG